PAPSSTSARVVFGVSTLSATEAPTPTLLLPCWVDLPDALAVSLRVFTATIDTSPVPAATDAPDVTTASVVSCTVFSANEPATPISPSLAPEFEVALNSWSWSPPTSFIVAPTVRPLAVTEAPTPTMPWLVMWATLIDTATPTAVPPSDVLAEPSE